MTSAVHQPLPALQPPTPPAPSTPTTLTHIDALPHSQLRHLLSDEDSLLELVAQFGYTRSIADHLESLRDDISVLKGQKLKADEGYTNQLGEQLEGLEELREEVGRLKREERRIKERQKTELVRALDGRIKELEVRLEEVEGKGKIRMKERVAVAKELYRVRIRREALREIQGESRGKGVHPTFESASCIKWTLVDSRKYKGDEDVNGSRESDKSHSSDSL